MIVKEHERAAPYSRLKAKMNARLAFNIMLKKLEKDIERVLERDALKGWPEEQADRIRESF